MMILLCVCVFPGDESPSRTSIKSTHADCAQSTRRNKTSSASVGRISPYFPWGLPVCSACLFLPLLAPQRLQWKKLLSLDGVEQCAHNHNLSHTLSILLRPCVYLPQLSPKRRSSKSVSGCIRRKGHLLPCSPFLDNCESRLCLACVE
jgi:hypothetical protein